MYTLAKDYVNCLKPLIYQCILTVCICCITNLLQFCIILARFFLLASSSSPRLSPSAEASGIVLKALRKLLACVLFNRHIYYHFMQQIVGHPFPSLNGAAFHELLQFTQSLALKFGHFQVDSAFKSRYEKCTITFFQFYYFILQYFSIAFKYLKTYHLM